MKTTFVVWVVRGLLTNIYYVFTIEAYVLYTAPSNLVCGLFHSLSFVAAPWQSKFYAFSFCYWEKEFRNSYLFELGIDQSGYYWTHVLSQSQLCDTYTSIHLWVHNRLKKTKLLIYHT